MNLDRSEKSAEKVIRAAMFARRSDLAGVARDVGVSADALFAFTHKEARLAPAVLEKLTTRIWGGAFTYNAATDMMESANKARPISIDTTCVAKLVLGSPPLGPSGPQRAAGAPPPPVKPAWVR